MITFDDEVTLYDVTTIKNEYGDPVKQFEEVTVLCNERSIGQSEFYQAQSVGLQPQIVLLMNKWNYDGQQFARYHGVDYKVLKTFMTTETFVKKTNVPMHEMLEVVLEKTIER